MAEPECAENEVYSAGRAPASRVSVLHCFKKLTIKLFLLQANIYGM